MEKLRNGKKTTRIISTNQISAWKAANSRKHNLRIDHDHFNSAYHELALADEGAHRDLRASSSSSLSLSFFSESDLAEAPSTSGCSSEMASVMKSKERKKEKAKEFMKKLKSMLPVKERMVKMDTLSTLEQVINNMKRLSEGQRRDGEFKTPRVYTGTFHSMDADKLVQSDMCISVSLKNHIVQAASQSLMAHLGYPADWWKGRLLRDFLSKKDINTVNGCLAQYCKEDHEPSKAAEESTSVSSSLTDAKEGTKCFFARIRRFRKLTEGFSIQNVVSYCSFVMTVTTAKPGEVTILDDDKDFSKSRKSLVIHCSPLRSAYTSESLPADRQFSIRHSSSCKYTDVEPSAIPLLGYLPQDINGRSIFDLYHPEDHEKLLDIHKKIIQSMGQPFKTDSIRLKTRNSCFVELETEWSSFINPWSMRLEFIIGQHTVIKGPSRPDVFEDTPVFNTEMGEMSADLRKTQEKILEVLQKPIQDVFTQPAPRPPVKEQAVTAQKRSSSQMDNSDTSIKPVKEKPKVQFQAQDIGEKYTVLDEKGISSIYNQLSYSYNIKRFLLSHPKPFSTVSDEDSTPAREDSEYDPMHADEEMPLEIPVVKPSSCGSSTQVHVSEQGHGEEMMSPPVFGDESVGPAAMMVPQREVTADNIRVLTEDSLKKHTKMQELLYLQKIAEEQPLMVNMRKIKGGQNSPQKRPWPREPNEVEEKAKHPCTISGIFRSSSNIFMQSFPAVSSCGLTPSTPTPATDRMFCQSSMMIPINAQGVIVSQPPGMTATLSVPTPAIPLVAVSPSGTTVVPTDLQAMRAPGRACPQPMVAGLQPQNIQWPYYPQPGYTLLPQVMGGFYRPLLQPVSVGTSQPGDRKTDTVAQTTTSGMKALDMARERPIKKDARSEFGVTRPEADHMISSGDDTGSSIMYLLEADSSMYEDSDSKKGTVMKGANKGVSDLTSSRHKHTRCAEPPWLRGVKWNNNTKMRYQMPQSRLKPVLKKDEKMLKKCQQGDLALESLEQLLEEISLPNNEETLDEEMDYLFYPWGQAKESEEKHMMEDKFMEVEITVDNLMGGGMMQGDDDGGGGGPSRLDSNSVIWEVPNLEEEVQQQEANTLANSPSKEDNANATDSITSTLVNKEGEKELGSLSQDASNTPEANKSPETDIPTIETTAVYMPTAQVELLDKSHSSPKEGSLSGDEGSAASSSDGNKQEMDSQSNYSKLSSDITPSDERSNEEAGSSHKESNASVQHMKVHSPGSSPAPGSAEEEEENMDQTGSSVQWEGIFKKLFIPLKVLVGHRLETPLPLPFWLAQSEITPSIAMTYTVPTRSLEDVLQEDLKRLDNISQSVTSKHQLLQLLNETYHKANTGTKESTSELQPNVSQENLPSSSLFPSKTTQISSQSKETGRTTTKVSMDTSAVTSRDNNESEGSAYSILDEHKDSDSKNSNEKLLNVITDHQPSPCIRKTELHVEQKGEAVSSDSNSDPVVSNSIPDSSTASCSSSLSILMLGKQTPSPSQGNPSTSGQVDIDSLLHDSFRAMTSESDIPAGMPIEDLIMNKVFVSDLTGVYCKELKNSFIMPE